MITLLSTCIKSAQFTNWLFTFYDHLWLSQKVKRYIVTWREVNCFFHKLLFIIINYIFLLYYLYQLTKFQYQIFTSQDIKHFRFSKNLQFRHMMTPSASFSYKFDNGTTFWCSFSAYFFLENFHDLPGNQFLASSIFYNKFYKKKLGWNIKMKVDFLRNFNNPLLKYLRDCLQILLLVFSKFT